MAQTTNLLHGSGNYLFQLVKFPEISFFLNEVALPGISIGKIIHPTQIHDFPIPGETMEFDDLSMTFNVDSNLDNYNVVHSWIVGMGFPEDSAQYTQILKRANNITSISELAKGYTDGTLIIFGNDGHPKIQVLFKDCFPTNISSIQFNSQNTDSVPLQCTATFTYSSYSFTVL
jgi:hypothetical protein